MSRVVPRAAALGSFLVIVALAPVHAAVITHLDFVSWTAAAGAPTATETFDGFLVDTSLVPAPVGLAGGMSLQVDPDAFDAFLGTIPPFESFIRAEPIPDTEGVNGTPHAVIRLTPDFGGADTQARLDFSGGATAWGAEFAFLGGVGGETFVIDVFAADDSLLGTVDMAPLANTLGSGTGFAGFTTTGGDVAAYLIFNTPTTIDSFDMDDLVVVASPVTAVPAPATWLLVVTGAAFVARRRARTRQGLD